MSSDAHLGVDDVAAMVTPYAPGLGILRAAIPAKLIERVLWLLRDAFDHVVVHTSGGFGDHVLAALDGTDLLLLPATVDIPALKTLQAAMDTLQLLNYPRERQRIVMLGQSKAGLLLSEVEKSLRMPVRGQLPYPPDLADSNGVPIVLADPDHPISQALQRFAEDCLTGRRQQRGSAPTSRNRRRDRPVATLGTRLRAHAEQTAQTWGLNSHLRC